MNRRSFLAAAVTLPFALRSMAEAPETHWIFLGTDKGAGVYRAPWDPETGEVGAIELAIADSRPTFMARHPKLDVLYTADERLSGEGAVSAFRMGRKDGSLQKLDEADSLGDGPCFVAVSKDGKALFAANYASGSVACLGLDSAGRFAGKGRDFPGKFEKPGPNAARQDASHMHCTVSSPDGKFVFACDLGSNTVSWYAFEAGVPTLVKKGSVAAQLGDGPRHLAFHPNGKWLYCINELGCVVTRYDWDGTALQRLPEFRTSTLEGFDGPLVGKDGIPSTGSEIAIVGGFLYAGTRGADLVAVYAMDAMGKLTHVQTLSTHGRIPRQFAFSPDGAFLLCANQGTDVAGTDSLAVFRRDAKSGKLDWMKSYAANTPMFVQFF